MGTKIVEVDMDLDDFEIDDVIEHLKWNAEELNVRQVGKIREITKDCEYEFAQEELLKNVLYQKIKTFDTLNDTMKLEVILTNLDKFSYNQICDIFENNGKNR